MKNWMRRFGVLTVLGALVCGALVAGCGGGDDDDDTTTVTNAANGTTTTTETDE
jgi:hypothetical protein